MSTPQKLAKPWQGVMVSILRPFTVTRNSHRRWTETSYCRGLEYRASDASTFFFLSIVFSYLRRGANKSLKAKVIVSR